MAVVEEPRWASSIVVLMGNYQVTLPVLGDVGIYERIAEKVAAGAIEEELRVVPFSWPKWPKYVCDRLSARSGGYVSVEEAAG